MENKNGVPKLFIATKALILHQGRVLLLRESGSYQDGTNKGRYDVPGGRLNPGEAFSEALKREVKEETGLSVTLGDPISVGEWRPVVRGEVWQIVGIFFECTSESEDVVLSTDHDAFEWIALEKIDQYPVIENLKPVFEKLRKKYLL